MANRTCNTCGCTPCNCDRMLDIKVEKGDWVHIDRDADGNITDITIEDVKKKNKCWIVTAYYGGNPLHPNVCTIRSLREQLIALKFIGPLIRQVNYQYLRLGSSPFGIWWAMKLMTKEVNIQKGITKWLCRVLLIAGQQIIKKQDLPSPSKKPY